jgi:hypothetical protein
MDTMPFDKWQFGRLAPPQAFHACVLKTNHSYRLQLQDPGALAVPPAEGFIPAPT